MGEMERRETPGVCETPHDEPCEGSSARCSKRECESRPARRARYDIVERAKPAARTLRLPALHSAGTPTADGGREVHPLRVMSVEGMNGR